jgi:arylsulfatase A-like enzyme
VGDAVPLARADGESSTAVFVNATDLYATILDLAGVNVQANDLVTSVSIVSTFAIDAAGLRDTLFTEVFEPSGGPPDADLDHKRAIQCSASHALCDVSYKLIQFLGYAEDELYDKDTDDPETTDLIDAGLSPADQIAYDYLAERIQTEGER